MTRTEFCNRFDDLLNLQTNARDRDRIVRRVTDDSVSVSFDDLHLASYRYDSDDPDTAAYATARMIDLVNLLR